MFKTNMPQKNLSDIMLEKQLATIETTTQEDIINKIDHIQIQLDELSKLLKDANVHLLKEDFLNLKTHVKGSLG